MHKEIALLAAYELTTNEKLIDTAQHKETDKWCFWIYLMRNGSIHRPSVNSDCIYDTKEQAKEAANDLIKSCKEYVENG